MAKNTTSKVGVWAFIIGIVLALIGGLIVGIIGGGAAAITAILVVLGLIVGFLNVTATETRDYLLAATSLVIVTYFGGNALSVVPVIGTYLSSVFSAIMTFVIPAVIIVALKAIYEISQD